MLPIATLLALAGFLGFGLGSDPTALPSTLIGKPLPPIRLSALHAGEPEFDGSLLRGEVSLVNIFASWCASCRVEHPTLMRLASEGQIPIHGIDWKDTPADGALWLRRLGNPYTRIGSDETGRAGIELGVTGAPESFLVDQEGRVRYKQIGPITDQVWTEVLAPLIAELRAENPNR